MSSIKSTNFYFFLSDVSNMIAHTGKYIYLIKVFFERKVTITLLTFQRFHGEKNPQTTTKTLILGYI